MPVILAKLVGEEQTLFLGWWFLFLDEGQYLLALSLALFVLKTESGL